MGKGVTYSSADDNIAIVSSTGLITGVGAGEVQITVTSTYDPNITAVCSVTVTMPPLHTDKEHNWGSGTKYSTSGVTVTKYTCACGGNKIQFASLDGTFASGSSNKDKTPSPYLKLADNNQSISYTFTIPEGISGNLYFDCIMDAFNTNGNYNYQKCKNSGNTWNFGITVNGSNFTIQNTTKFNDPSMLGSGTDGDYSQRGLCFVGGISLKSGSNTIVFKRIDSYNPLIANFVIIY